MATAFSSVTAAPSPAVASPGMSAATVDERGVSAHARSGPDRPAIVTGDSVLTYGELAERAARLATVLGRHGAGPGHPVATVLPNGAEQFEVATAAAMLDAPYLPVNWHLRAGELAYIFGDAAVAVVVGHTDLRDQLVAATTGAEGTFPLVLVGDDYERAIADAGALPGAASRS